MYRGTPNIQLSPQFQKKKKQPRALISPPEMPKMARNMQKCHAKLDQN
jgi:hypothetical protein